MKLPVPFTLYKNKYIACITNANIYLSNTVHIYNYMQSMCVHTGNHMQRDRRCLCSSLFFGLLIGWCDRLRPLLQARLAGPLFNELGIPTWLISDRISCCDETQSGRDVDRKADSAAGPDLVAPSLQYFS